MRHECASEKSVTLMDMMNRRMRSGCYGDVLLYRVC